MGPTLTPARGKYYVVEADESDKSFTFLSPAGVIVTNIEADHLDHYKDLGEIFEKFKQFMASVPEDGPVVVCGEEEALVCAAREVHPRAITYGLGEECDARVVSYGPHGVGSSFTLELPDGTQVEGKVKQNPGVHNVLNAAAVLTLIWALGLDVQKAACVLADFAGVRRRFDLVGEAQGVTVVDDYAHHPTEIAATIAAAKTLDFSRVHVLFQPHRYSRAPLFTEVLHDEFGAAFDDADTVTFMDVYPAGEAPVPGVSGKTFLNVVLDHGGHPAASYVPRRLDVVPHMAALAKPGDLVITMGAGDVTAIGPQLVEALGAANAGAGSNSWSHVTPRRSRRCSSTSASTGKSTHSSLCLAIPPTASVGRPAISPASTRWARSRAYSSVQGRGQEMVHCRPGTEPACRR